MMITKKEMSYAIRAVNDLTVDTGYLVPYTIHNSTQFHIIIHLSLTLGQTK
jgi:hypothetical protein